MKKILSLVAAALMSAAMMAGQNDLLWDYTEGAPMENPDRGLSYLSAVNDVEGVKNGLKGVKLNSSGWCSFTKAPVAGRLKLTFGPRSGVNPASLQVFTVGGEQNREMSIVGTTGEVTRLRTRMLNLTAEQNTIYITRLLETETVLQKIEFEEGLSAETVMDENEDDEPIASDEEIRAKLSENALFFLNELQEANKTGNKTIYLPNGIYDLGELTLTSIEADHVAVIGESMEGTIIRNAPDYRRESIDKSATLRIGAGVKGTYLQNLTIENALDYYKDDNGRAVALWDQGTQTICKRVRLLSHQDTYYSNYAGGLKYFEDCEIVGTVDFICGDGNVYFKNTLLYCKPRSKEGSGTDALTASGAQECDRGYVFDSCRVKSECPVVSLGRSWKNHPRCVFLNTVLDYSAGRFMLSDGNKIQRWTVGGMSVLPDMFGEYNTMDTEGRVVSPAANEVHFTYKGVTKPMQTILSPQQAGVYTMEYVLGEWSKELKETIKIFNQLNF